jgi:3-hydroxy-9,10-secoandrosta-1,3,5(10)-triene-9,17-dione monooxygenase
MEQTKKPRPFLPQPEPGLTAETLVERAAALRALLRAEQDKSDWRGHYGEEVHEAFRKAGFYRILQPRMFGGYECEPATFLKVIMEIARGQPGAAWCFTLAGSHGYFVAAHYPEEAQRALFGADGEFRAAQVVGPFGTMRRADGGYVVSGVWPFASGIPVSTHFIGGSLAPVAGGPPKHVFFATPRENVEMLADWGEEKFMGMQASGSNSVKLTNVFVPDLMIVDVNMMFSSDAFPQGSHGTRLHGNPMYLLVAIGWFHCEFGAILTGAARAALDEFREVAQKKVMFGSPEQLKRLHDPVAQNVFGTALGLADSAEALTLAAVNLYTEQLRRFGRDGTPISIKDTFEVWGLAGQACRLACEAVETLFRAAGASTGRRGERLQRYFRDVEMYWLHIQAQPMLPTVRGQVEFDVPSALLGLAGSPK